MFRVLAGTLFLLLAVTPVLAQNQPIPDPNQEEPAKANLRIYRETSPNGQYTVDMFPAAGGKTALGVARQKNNSKNLWVVDFYSRRIALANDGEHLVRLGTPLAPKKTEPKGDPAKHAAITFYNRGEVVNSYTVAALLKGPPVKGTNSAGKEVLFWLAQNDGFEKDGKTYRLTLVDGTVYTFDLANGKVSDKTTNSDIIKNEKRGIDPVAKGCVAVEKATVTAAAFRAFAAQVFGDVLAEHSKENLIISPADIATNLALVSVGAKGETAQQFHKVLGLEPNAEEPDQVIAQLENLYQALGIQDAAALAPGIEVKPAKKEGVIVEKVADGSPFKDLLKPGQTILKINGQKISSQEEFDQALTGSVRSIAALVLDNDGKGEPVQIVLPLPSPLLLSAVTLWAGAQDKINPEFQDKLNLFRHTAVHSIDEENPQKSAAEIDAAIALATRGKIKNLYSAAELKETKELILASASLFAGDWLFPLTKITKPEPFHVTHEKSVPAPMMQGKFKLQYIREPDCDVLQLPYKGNRFAMVFILPEAMAKSGTIEKQLTTKQLAEWFHRLDGVPRRMTEVFLPRFSIDGQKLSLKKTLTVLGLNDAFDPKKADFSGLSKSKGVHLGDLMHRAFVSVDEKGTVAAAATVAELVPFAPDEKTTFTFRADRPFLFLIRDRATDSVLFIGRLYDPSL